MGKEISVLSTVGVQPPPKVEGYGFDSCRTGQSFVSRSFSFMVLLRLMKVVER